MHVFFINMFNLKNVSICNTMNYNKTSKKQKVILYLQKNIFTCFKTQPLYYQSFKK